MAQLMHAFEKKEFSDGQAIIKQGDKGDLFYILDSGSCDISIEGKVRGRVAVDMSA